MVAHSVPKLDRRELVSEENRRQAQLGHQGAGRTVLVTLQEVFFRTSISIINVLHFINIKVVVCEHLSLVNEGSLVDGGSVQVKLELVPEPSLDFLHLLVVSKREMIDLVREVQLLSLHVQFLNHISVCMSGNMEVARDFVDGD